MRNYGDLNRRQLAALREAVERDGAPAVGRKLDLAPTGLAAILARGGKRVYPSTRAKVQALVPPVERLPRAVAPAPSLPSSAGPEQEARVHNAAAEVFRALAPLSKDARERVLKAALELVA